VITPAKSTKRGIRIGKTVLEHMSFLASKRLYCALRVSEVLVTIAAQKQIESGCAVTPPTL
jgi:hypothetical protein